MQDGRDLPADEAGQWLRDNRPEISIRWEAAEERDDDTYRRLLVLLFGPRTDSGAA